MSKQDEQKKKLFGLGTKKEKVHAAVEMAAVLKEEAAPEEKILTFFLPQKLDDDIKAESKRSGQKMKVIINSQLERLFNEQLELTNDYNMPDESLKRSVRISADLAKKLDAYAADRGMSKRFIIEALLSDYLRK